jgi:hypothetical protein
MEPRKLFMIGGRTGAKKCVYNMIETRDKIFPQTCRAIHNSSAVRAAAITVARQRIRARERIRSGIIVATARQTLDLRSIVAHKRRRASDRFARMAKQPGDG